MGMMGRTFSPCGFSVCYNLDLECLPKCPCPQDSAILGDGKTFKRWGLVGSFGLGACP
jgi:hypothetical protein